MKFQRIRSDQVGYILVLAALGMMAFMGVSMLAIDIGMVATARTQAQAAADGAALAGAVALVYNDFDDRSSSGPAVQSAIQVGQANQVMGSNTSVTVADVAFPNDEAGDPTRVQVTVFRSSAR